MSAFTEGSAHARRTDPETSHDAARSVEVTPGRAAVLRAFLNHGDMTDEQLSRCPEVKHLSPSGIRTRRKELADAGLLGYTHRDRKMETGRWGMVFRLSHGREMYEDLLTAYRLGALCCGHPWTTHTLNGGECSVRGCECAVRVSRIEKERAQAAGRDDGEYCDHCGDYRPGEHPEHDGGVR